MRLRKKSTLILISITILFLMTCLSGCKEIDEITAKDLNGTWYAYFGSDCMTIQFNEKDNTYTANNFLCANGKFRITEENAIKLTDTYNDKFILVPFRNFNDSWELKFSEGYIDVIFTKTPNEAIHGAEKDDLTAPNISIQSSGYETTEVLGYTISTLLEACPWEMQTGEVVVFSDGTISWDGKEKEQYKFQAVGMSEDGYTFSINTASGNYIGKILVLIDEEDSNYLPTGYQLEICFNGGDYYVAVHDGDINIATDQF